MMKAVSFMYVRPPGYNAESAKAAEIADESVREHHNNTSFEDPQTQTQTDAPSTSRYNALYYFLPYCMICFHYIFELIFSC